MCFEAAGVMVALETSEGSGTGEEIEALSGVLGTWEADRHIVSGWKRCCAAAKRATEAHLSWRPSRIEFGDLPTEVLRYES